jgi:hypothetical protein
VSDKPPTEAAVDIVAGPVTMVVPWTADIPATTIAATETIANKAYDMIISFIYNDRYRPFLTPALFLFC